STIRTTISSAAPTRASRTGAATTMARATTITASAPTTRRSAAPTAASRKAGERPGRRGAPHPGNAVLGVMRDAEGFLAAVEDQRHDQVFLVVEMADQPLEQRAAGGRVIIAATAQRVGIAR